MKSPFPRPFQLAGLCLLLILAAIGLHAAVDLVLNGPDSRLVIIVVRGAVFGIVFPILMAFFFYLLKDSAELKRQDQSHPHEK